MCVPRKRFPRHVTIVTTLDFDKDVDMVVWLV
jgi:hypothetical protein